MENKKKERNKKEKEKAEYAEGLKKTLTPLLFGVLAGVICFLIFISTPYLVSTNGSLKNDLDNGVIPENLINLFETKGTPLSENIAVRKDGKYLFNIDASELISELEENLNKGVISEELKMVFETKAFPLPENATIRKEKDDEWEITTEEKIYIIRKNAEKLNIYESNDKWRIDEEKYLFSTDIGFEDDLNNRTVSEALKNVFKTEGFPLSGNSENINVTKNEDKWVITDEEKKKAYFVREKAEKLNIYGEKKNYIIRKDAEKLNIYSTPKLEDNWLLIAILLVLVQKFVYPFLHTSIKGAKDWIYISFMTIFCWFISFTLLLMLFF